MFGTKEKFNIFEYFPGPGKLLQRKYFITPTAQLKEAVSRAGDYSGHTRAFLKIQDGCNYRCSYCIIPFTRGASRSVPMEEVVNQAEILAEKGYREIVLTGVHIGEYGKDIGKGSLLPALCSLLSVIVFSSCFVFLEQWCAADERWSGASEGSGAIAHSSDTIDHVSDEAHHVSGAIDHRS